VHKRVIFARDRILGDPRVEITPMITTHRPYVHNLHLIQKDFLDGDYDYLITMDDDNPPLKNIIDLIFLDKDVMVCPTPVWNDEGGSFPIYFNVMVDEGKAGLTPLASSKRFKGVGLYEIDAGGSGCMIIARRVLEKMKAPFMRTWSDDGIVKWGGDFSFCRRAKEQGFSIWTHLDYMCQHFKELELTSVLKVIMEMKANG